MIEMKENAIIEIEGIIEAGGDKDSVSLTTTGSYYIKGGKHYLVYKESEATGFEGHMTTIKAWDNGVSMTRFSQRGSSTLIIEKDAINLCNYETFAGPIMLDINGIDIDNQLTDAGGKLHMEYSLSADGMLLSENKVNITVKEIKK